MREPKQEVNSFSGYVTVLLSLIALLAVVAGYGEARQKDEGTAAHIFQLAIALLVPTVLVFLATGDWSQPLRTARPLMFSTAALAFAFGALYYLEHYRNPKAAAGQWNRPFVHETQGSQGCAHVVPPRRPERSEGTIEIRFLLEGQWEGRRVAHSVVMRIKSGRFLDRLVMWLSSQVNL